MANEVTWGQHSGVLTNNDLNKDFRRVAQPMFRFRQFVKFKEAFGKHKGQTQNWLKVSNAGPATGTTTYGGSLTETNTMPEARQPLIWGTVTVDEYGLSIPLTFKVQALSEFDIKSIIRESLLNDHVKVVEGLIETQFDACKIRVVGTASDSAIVKSTDGTCTKTNTTALSEHYVRKICLELKKRNVPGWSSLGGDYASIASVEALESLQGKMVTINQYTESGYQRILNGEQGRLHAVRFVEDSFASRFVYTAATRSASSTAVRASSQSFPGGFWSKAKSGAAYFFGSPTVREIVAVPEEIRAKVVTDYGRSHGLAWYMIGGWKIEWDTEPDCRIVKWDSKA